MDNRLAMNAVCGSGQKPEAGSFAAAEAPRNNRGYESDAEERFTPVALKERLDETLEQPPRCDDPSL